MQHSDLLHSQALNRACNTQTFYTISSLNSPSLCAAGVRMHLAAALRLGHSLHSGLWVLHVREAFFVAVSEQQQTHIHVQRHPHPQQGHMLTHDTYTHMHRHTHSISHQAHMLTHKAEHKPGLDVELDAPLIGEPSLPAACRQTSVSMKLRVLSYFLIFVCQHLAIQAAAGTASQQDFGN